MINRTEKIIRGIILAAVFIAMVAGSCKKKGDKLIPDKALISILTDVYIADGLQTVPAIRDKFSSKDSVSVYIDVIERHGYSKPAMDNTIKYYVINNPKKLIRIYDKVQTVLSEMQSQAETDPVVPQEQEPIPVINNSSYILPDPLGSEKPGFNYVLQSPCYYKLTFTVTVYADDKSVNPCFTAYLYNTDSTISQKPVFLPSIKYSKNGIPHTYTISGKLEKNETLALKGWYYDFENKPDLQGQHAIIENISFSISGKEI